ncbi:MAG: efflux RND transporter periplasmic adaptor subunit [Nannocystaceae bacterium]|nr:efflux RND transporter periplasmic adaptor subunit [Deltaproteobacteria bacterium]MBP7292181.1 efflux RND transporter periplasmic adaptor subunit [Nannocystaceae bacterium]
MALQPEIPLDESSPPDISPASLRRGRWPWWLAALACVAVGTAFALHRSAPTDAAESAPEPDVPSAHDGRIVYSEAFVARAGLEVAAVESKQVLPVIEVIGTVTLDPRHVAAVGTRIPGRVTEIDVVAGDRVAAGDRLARFESADLGGAQADLLSARARATAARHDVERKRLLVEEGIASQRSAQQAEAEYASLEAELHAAEQRVRALGGRSTKRRLGVFELRAPIDGEVVRVQVQRGESVDPNHTAFEIADLSSVWVELALFERDLSRVSIGDAVTLQPRGDGRPPLQGTIAHVGRVLDERTRTAPVRIVVDNDDRRLFVGQAVHAQVHATSLAVQGPAVPRDAVVLVDGQPTVFVEIARRVVEPREVELAAQGEHEVAIAEGLAEGERVVTAGAFAVKSELFR